MISDNDGDDGFDDYIVVIFNFRKRARVDTPSNRLPLSRHFCVIVGSGGSGQLPNPKKKVSLRLLVACLPCVCHLRIMDLSYVCRFSAVCLAISHDPFFWFVSFWDGFASKICEIGNPNHQNDITDLQSIWQPYIVRGTRTAASFVEQKTSKNHRITLAAQAFRSGSHNGAGYPNFQHPPRQTRHVKHPFSLFFFHH